MNGDKIIQTIIGEGVAIGEVSQGGTLIISQSKGSKAKLRDLDFMKSVKSLLELYGFTCSVNYLINGIVVDLWGEYSVGIGAYQVAIMCICSDGLIEPEIINEVQWSTFGPLSDKLTTARKLAVSSTGFSQEAIITLSKYNIEYLSYSDILSKLIDFRFYLGSLVESWMNDKVRHYYIPMRAEQEGKRQSREIIKLERYVREFIEDNSRRSLAILGEYGTGKTTLSRLIACEQARKYLRLNGYSPLRIPILINLGEFNKTLNIESLIVSHLDSFCKVNNPKFQLFKKMNESGMLLLLFDGFDEMAVKVDFNTLIINIREIYKLASPLKAKVIITSRPEYFKNLYEEDRVFNPQSTEKQINIDQSGIHFDRLYVQTFDLEQIEVFLEKRLKSLNIPSSEIPKYKKVLDETYDLKGLAKRPVLLDMIVRTFPQLVKHKSDREISVNILYETFLIGEMDRQSIEKKRTFLLEGVINFSALFSMVCLCTLPP